MFKCIYCCCVNLKTSFDEITNFDSIRDLIQHMIIDHDWPEFQEEEYYLKRLKQAGIIKNVI